MPMIDPYTGEILPDPITPVQQNPNVLPPLPPPQLPQYPQVQMPPVPPTPEQRIQQMGGGQAFGAALAALGYGLQGKPDPTMARLQQQYQTEMEPYRIQAGLAGQRAGQQFEAGVGMAREQFGQAGRERLAGMEAGEAMRRIVEQGRIQAGISREEQAGQERRLEKQLKAQKEITSTEITARERLSVMNAALEAFTSGDPEKQAAALNIIQANPTTFAGLGLDVSNPDQIRKFAEVARTYKMDLVKANTDKLKFENNLQQFQGKIWEQMQKDPGKVPHHWRVAIGVESPMSPLQQLELSQVVKGLKDPQFAELYQNSIIGMKNPEMFMFYHLYKKNGGNVEKTLENFNKLDKRNLGEMVDLLRVINMAQPTGDPNEQKVRSAMFRSLFLRTLKSAGYDDPALTKIIESEGDAMKAITQQIVDAVKKSSLFPTTDRTD